MINGTNTLRLMVFDTNSTTMMANSIISSPISAMRAFFLFIFIFVLGLFFLLWQTLGLAQRLRDNPL